jgi:hypothetical protein
MERGSSTPLRVGTLRRTKLDANKRLQKLIAVSYPPLQGYVSISYRCLQWTKTYTKLFLSLAGSVPLTDETMFMRSWIIDATE